MSEYLTRRELMARSCAAIGVGAVLYGLADSARGEESKLVISELKAASEKPYVIDYGGFTRGTKQYIDRDYLFDYLPEFLKGQTKILTAGNDKHIDENSPCFSFHVNLPVTVYVVYADKMRVLPNWLKQYEDTRWKVTRKDSNASTLKGIFTLFAREFPAGQITLNGNLSKAMGEDPVFRRMNGGTYCMYSVVVAPKTR